MRILSLSLAMIAPSPALAGGLCDKAMTTIEINQCAQSEYQAADRTLNSAYRAALERIESDVSDTLQRRDAQQGLIEAQRLWIRFRDKDCGAVYDLLRDGTVRGVMYWGCKIARTEQRITELEAFSLQE